jgi:hypothetical protein
LQAKEYWSSIDPLNVASDVALVPKREIDSVLVHETIDIISHIQHQRTYGKRSKGCTSSDSQQLPCLVWADTVTQETVTLDLNIDLDPNELINSSLDDDLPLLEEQTVKEDFSTDFKCFQCLVCCDVFNTMNLRLEHILSCHNNHSKTLYPQKCPECPLATDPEDQGGLNQISNSKSPKSQKKKNLKNFKFFLKFLKKIKNVIIKIFIYYPAKIYR